MTTKDPEARLFRERVKWGELMHVKQMLKDGVNFQEAGETLREWTPLHIACWGTVKPQYDREIVEAILVAALKAGKDTEQAVRAAKDAQSGETPLDLAKQRRENVEANPPKPGADDKDWLDEKRKLDKIIEWIEKGLPAGS